MSPALPTWETRHRRKDRPLELSRRNRTKDFRTWGTLKLHNARILFDLRDCRRAFSATCRRCWVPSGAMSCCRDPFTYQTIQNLLRRDRLVSTTDEKTWWCTSCAQASWTSTSPYRTSQATIDICRALRTWSRKMKVPRIREQQKRVLLALERPRGTPSRTRPSSVTSTKHPQSMQANIANRRWGSKIRNGAPLISGVSRLMRIKRRWTSIWQRVQATRPTFFKWTALWNQARRRTSKWTSKTVHQNSSWLKQANSKAFERPVTFVETRAYRPIRDSLRLRRSRVPPATWANHFLFTTMCRCSRVQLQLLSNNNRYSMRSGSTGLDGKCWRK